MKESDLINAIDKINLDKSQIKILKQNISDQLHKRLKQRILLKAVCVSVTIILLFGAVLIPLAYKNSFFDKEELSLTDSVSHSSGSYTDLQEIPSWYEPGEFTVKTISGFDYSNLYQAERELNIEQVSDKAVSYKGRSIDIELPSDLIFVNSKYTDIVEVKAIYGECKNRKGLFYDYNNDRVIRLGDMFTDIAEKNSLKYDDFSVITYNHDLTIAIMSIYISGESSKCIYFDVINKEIRELPIKDNSIMTMKITPDFDSIFYTEVNVSRSIEDIYKLDLNTFKITAISNINVSYLNSDIVLNLSESGDILYFKVDENDSNQTDEKWIVYNRKMNRSFVFVGDLIRFAQNDSIMIMDTPSGIKLFDLTTGIETTEESLDEHEKYQIKVLFEADKEADTIYQIYIYDNISKKILVAEDVNSYHITGDYIYTFSDKTGYINIYSVKNNDSFNIKLNDNFLRAIKIDKVANDLCYYFILDTNKKNLLIYYSAVY